MSNQRKIERRKEIAVVREAGRQAALAGKNVNSCPYTDCDKFQWMDAYRNQAQLIEHEKEMRLKLKLLSATTVEDIKEYLFEKEGILL